MKTGFRHACVVALAASVACAEDPFAAKWSVATPAVVVVNVVAV